MNSPKHSFYRYSSSQRHELFIRSQKLDSSAESLLSSHGNLSLADQLVESSVGYFPLALGLLDGLLVNGVSYQVPMASEEASVIAAANNGAKTLGSIDVEVPESLLRGTLYFEGPGEHIKNFFQEKSLEFLLSPLLQSMTARGGGFRSFSLEPSLGSAWCLSLYIDTVDSMGANLMNSVLEFLSDFLVSHFETYEVRLAILSNDARHRLSRAFVSVPFESLARGTYSGIEVAQRIVWLMDLAYADPLRAVTHNKGIMNGITAFALASGQDTRAIEASVHAFAAQSGVYRGLSSGWIEEEKLCILLEIPLLMAAVGGAVGVHPLAKAFVDNLGNSSKKLTAIAASVGLVQNFAALWALSTEGLQKGHMRHHRKRLGSL